MNNLVKFYISLLGILFFAFLQIFAIAQESKIQASTPVYNNWYFSVKLYKKLLKQESNKGIDKLIFSPYALSFPIAYLASGAEGNTQISLIYTLLHRNLPYRLFERFINSQKIASPKIKTDYKTTISNDFLNIQNNINIRYEINFKENQYRFYKSILDKYTAIELPCQDDICMLIAFNNEKENEPSPNMLERIENSTLLQRFSKNEVLNFEKKLSEDFLEEIFYKKLKNKKLKLDIHSFKAKNELLFNNLLNSSGMSIAFSPAADFSGLQQNNSIKIGNINQIVEFSLTSQAEKLEQKKSANNGIEEINLNKDFFYMIYEKNFPNKILLMGRYSSNNK